MHFSKNALKKIAYIGIPVLVATGAWVIYEQSQPFAAEMTEIDEMLSALPGVDDVVAEYREGTWTSIGEDYTITRVYLQESATAEQVPAILDTYAAAPLPAYRPNSEFSTPVENTLKIQAFGHQLDSSSTFSTISFTSSGRPAEFLPVTYSSAKAWFRLQTKYHSAQMTVEPGTDNTLSERSQIDVEFADGPTLSQATREAVSIQNQVSKDHPEPDQKAGTLRVTITKTVSELVSQIVKVAGPDAEILVAVDGLEALDSKDLGFEIDYNSEDRSSEIQFRPNGEIGDLDSAGTPDSPLAKELTAAVRTAFALSEHPVSVSILSPDNETLGSVSTNYCVQNSNYPLDDWLFRERDATWKGVPPPECAGA